MPTTRGGLRPNAGRKPKNNGILYVRMPQDIIAYIHANARLRHITVAEYLGQLVQRDTP